MRVLYLSDVYYPRVNGVSTSIQTFREDLRACGVESLLIAPRYGASPAEAPGDPDAAAGTAGADAVLRIGAARVPGDPEDRRMRWRPLQRALGRLQSEDLQLVHIHTPFVAHYAGIAFARRRGIPALATYHTFFEEYLHHYVPLLPRALGRAVARHFTRAQCAQLAAVIAPSEPMAELLRGYGVSVRLEVIPTGLPAVRYLPGDGTRFRRDQGIEPGRPLLLYVGRIAHEKNLELLLHSELALRRTHPEALLVLAGEGPARASLQGLARRLGIEAHVRFIGYLERTQGLADCYAAANVFVFASRTETQGLVLLEALAQGCPVVSTAHLGTAAVLREDGGAQIAPDEPEGFARAIAQVLDDAAHAARLSAQARAYARGWSSALMARRLAQLYRELVPLAHADAGIRCDPAKEL